MYSSSLLVIAIAALASARTDLSGCVSSETVPNGGAWYVPGTGEICKELDCGGGRAPPKATVVGCPAYEGTATYSPSFIALATSSAAKAFSPSTAVSTALITGAPSSTEEVVVIASSSAPADDSIIVDATSTASTFLPIATLSLNSSTGTNSSLTGSAPTASSSSFENDAVTLASMSGLLVAVAGCVFLL